MNKFPLYYLTWNTTCRCNLKCRHCYNEPFVKESALNELSTKEAMNMINDAISLGLRAILFTGGESLLRNDFLQLVKFAKRKKILVFFASNGTLISNNFTQKFRGLIDKINISIDAGSAEKHDKIRGARGSFYKSLSAVKKLKKNFDVSIVFTAHSNNLFELSSVAKIAKKNGVLLTIKRYIPVGRGASKELILSKKNYIALVKKINDLKKDQKISFKDPFPDSYGKKKNTYGGCLAGIHSLSIDFNGNVYICTKLKVLLGNIKINSLSKIWNNSNILKQLRDRRLKGKCKNCERILSCGGCRAAAYAKTGDFLASDPLCFL
jgi:radical SAM protein with 4Fe4S-binding SPASM domain